MKWLDKIIKDAVKSETSDLSVKVLEDVKSRLNVIEDSQRTFQQNICKELNDRLSLVENGIQPRFEVLEGKVNQSIAVAEGNVDDKLAGLYSSLDDRISKGNGNGRAYVGVMKRLAQLEDVKDAVEHRRSSVELVQRRDELKRSLVDLYREGKQTDSVQIELNTIQWVINDV